MYNELPSNTNTILTLLKHGRFFDPNFKVVREGVKLFFVVFFCKSFASLRIFMYGLTKDILSSGVGGGGYTTPPHRLRG